MLRNLIVFFTLGTLFGCTAHIKESSFIVQDNTLVNYQTSQLKQWQSLFPNFDLQTLALTSSVDNTELKGLYLKHKSAEDVIFYIPGNGMKVSEGGIYALQKLAKLNKSIVIFDRRGLGASAGNATISTLVSDATEQYQFIKNQLKADKVIVHGFSLGSFVAGQLAKQIEVDALVLQGSATNVDDWIDLSMPWYSKLFVTVEVEDIFHTIDNQEIVSQHYRGPLLIIGGEKDEQVPVELSNRLFDASQSASKSLIIADNADHNTMLDKDQELMLYQQFLSSLN